VAEPLRVWGEPEPIPLRPRWHVRARRAFRGRARAVLGWAARPARLIPGLGALGCAVAGSFVLWGVGVALLVAAGFLLALDARTPRG
jgi:hypothetical protein